MVVVSFAKEKWYFVSDLVFVALNGRAQEKKSPSGGFQSRTFFLFSDVLIWAQKKRLSSRFNYKGKLWLDGAVLVAEPPNEPSNAFTLLWYK